MSAHGKNLKLFAANSNPALARNIAELLGIPLGSCTVGKFSDGEISLSINETVRGCDVFILQSTCDPVNDNLMELLIMIDAMKRASAMRITAVIPYFGYARQDRKVKAHDPISAKLVANLIYHAGVDRILTMDLHSLQIQGFFDIPVDHLIGAYTFRPYYKVILGEELSEAIIVSPDVGSVARSRFFAQLCGSQLAIIDKKRERANESMVCNIIGDVRGRTCILTDDMIDTAGTICNAAKALIETGGAKAVYACATHAVLSGPAYQRIAEAPFKEVALLDTIPVPKEKLLPNMRVLSSVSHFAETIERIHLNLPVSTLFNR